MRRSKGQFLIISAVIIGVLMISAASIIASIQSQDVSHSSIPYDINNIKQTAEEVDAADEADRAVFEQMVSETSGYATDVEPWDSEDNGVYDCFNVTLSSSDTTLNLDCVG